ncbi:uncharacterized protein LOC123397975 isoform X2 [Hordeum vulgare subsp. vulgare]|nr:uncharacterized protein LOC123397975 isoform X2 [Hordeum vulgare subsp. vulgare]
MQVPLRGCKEMIAWSISWDNIRGNSGEEDVKLKAAMAGVPYWAEEEDEKKEGLGMSRYWVAVAFKYLPYGTSLYGSGKYV